MKTSANERFCFLILSVYSQKDSGTLDWNPLAKRRAIGNRCQSHQVFSLNDDTLTAIEIFSYFEIDFRSAESAPFGSCVVLHSCFCTNQSFLWC
jgi:hypothetical protein